jgi:hypothetical protein
VFEICANTHFAKPFYLLAYSSDALEEGELLFICILRGRKVWIVVLIKEGVREKGEII